MQTSNGIQTADLSNPLAQENAQFKSRNHLDDKFW
jgi:hypothetical protein